MRHFTYYSRLSDRRKAFRWILGAFLAIELHDLPVNCGTQEFNQIIPPAGQSACLLTRASMADRSTACGAYLQAFLGSGGPGFLANPDATDVCQYCQARFHFTL